MKDAKRPAMTYKLYTCKRYPHHWIVRATPDGAPGVLYLVPAVADGWRQRENLLVLNRELRPAPSYNAFGLGIPGFVYCSHTNKHGEPCGTQDAYCEDCAELACLP